VQNITNKSDAWGEDDLGRREAEVICFRLFEGVGGERCTDCEGIEFQMTGAAEQKLKLVVDGVGTRK